MPVLLSLVLALFASPALAGESVDDLRKELEDRVARNNWAAADRAFDALTEQTRPTPHDLLLGGRAARALGHVNDASERFEDAAKKDAENPEVVEQLDAISSRYGEVKLRAKGVGGGVPLRPKTPLIDSEYRLVLETARGTLSETGKYDGLLPLGAFTLGDQAFEVTAEGKAKAVLK